MKCKTPKFRDKDSYKTYKTLVERWSNITDEEPNARATALILNIENNKALNEVVKRTSSIKSVDDLLKVLDNIFRHEVDPVGDLFNKYKDFDTIARTEEETIKEYIDRFTYLKE